MILNILQNTALIAVDSVYPIRSEVPVPDLCADGIRVVDGYESPVLCRTFMTTVDGEDVDIIVCRFMAAGGDSMMTSSYCL